MQTEENREGMYEGIIACYLQDYIDSEEFWEVIDNRIFADHEKVIDFTTQNNFADRFAKKLGASIGSSLHHDILTNNLKNIKLN